MKLYRINEVFYSIQGEGRNAGTPMVFVRFSGCNMSCPFCDTKHEEAIEIPAQGIVNAIQANGPLATEVCLTGGEPGLQIDEQLFHTLVQAGMSIYIETNGTLRLPECYRHSAWITVSPKAMPCPGLKDASEVKLLIGTTPCPVSPQEVEECGYVNPSAILYVQPVWTDDSEARAANIAVACKFVKENDFGWLLSTQIHKFLHLR